MRHPTLKHPMFSGRRELERLVTWLRRDHRFTSDHEMGSVARHIAECIESGTFCKETQDLRDASEYPTDADVASAIGGWAQHGTLTELERETLLMISRRLAAMPQSNEGSKP